MSSFQISSIDSQFAISTLPKSKSRSSSSTINSLYEIEYVSGDHETTLPLVNPYEYFAKMPSAFSVKGVRELIKPSSNRKVMEYVQSKFSSCQVPATEKKQFISLNIPEHLSIYMMSEECMTWSVPNITPDGLQQAKDTQFASWVKDYFDTTENLGIRRHPFGLVDVSPRRQYAKCDPFVLPALAVSDLSLSSLSTLITMASRRQETSPPMPPGATGLAANGQASSSCSNSYPQMSRNAMFIIDPSVNSFFRATWQGYYQGPWKSWRAVPDQTRDGKRLCKISTGSLSLMTCQEKRKKAAKGRKSDPVGKGVHKHNSGPVGFARTEYNMMNESGEPPSNTALVRRRHMNKDWTFVDYRAEELVTQAEMEATQVSNTDGSPQSPSATSAPSRILVNQGYLKNAKGKRAHVYGLSSLQYREHAPSARVPASLARNLELELRFSGMETSLQSVTADVSAVKADVATMNEDFSATRAAINELLQTLRPQAPST
ncbi:hypothetical protein Bca4012_083972 [Brassica carinata]